MRSWNGCGGAAHHGSPGKRTAQPLPLRHQARDIPQVREILKNLEIYEVSWCVNVRGLQRDVVIFADQ
jgi:hypothetical protein